MPKFTFSFTPADDASVDPEFTLIVDGAPTSISIQDARSYGGGYGVNEYGNVGTDDMWVQFLGTAKTLAAAKAKAIAFYGNHR